jgi:hypothetical protein
MHIYIYAGARAGRYDCDVRGTHARHAILRGGLGNDGKDGKQSQAKPRVRARAREGLLSLLEERERERERGKDHAILRGGLVEDGKAREGAWLTSLM